MQARLLPSMALSALALCTSADAITSRRQTELLDLVHQDCGSCHGMYLSGGLGPALTPQTLAAKSEKFLAVTISEGRAGTPMPPWKTLLSEAEITWIVNYLKSRRTDP